MQCRKSDIVVHIWCRCASCDALLHEVSHRLLFAQDTCRTANSEFSVGVVADAAALTPFGIPANAWIRGLMDRILLALTNLRCIGAFESFELFHTIVVRLQMGENRSCCANDAAGAVRIRTIERRTVGVFGQLSISIEVGVVIRKLDNWLRFTRGYESFSQYGHGHLIVKMLTFPDQTSHSQRRMVDAGHQQAHS